MSTVPHSTLPSDYVTKYAPTVKFHGDERNFPANIEFLLLGATLKKRVWRPAEMVPNQSTGVPAVAVLDDVIYMLYTDDDMEIYVTKSADGQNWTEAKRIGQQTGIPAVTAYKGKLWMVYTGHHSSQLYVTCTADGKHWEGPREIADQRTSVPALTVFEDHLFICYSAAHSSQLYQSQSDNGWDWYNLKEIDGQGSDIPAITVVPGPDGDQLLMVYPSNDRGDDNQLLQTRYTTSKGWSDPKWIDGQQAHQVGLTTYNGTAIMAYSGNHSADMYASTSTDGVNWQFFQIADQRARSWPAMFPFKDRTYMAFSGTSSAKQIWVSSCTGAKITPSPDKANPTQQDLVNCADDPDWWIDINDDRWRADNQPAATAIYYAVQEDDSNWYIHYIFLYAGQHGQTVRGERAGTDFNCQLWTVGEHPGDLERFMMTISKINVGDVVSCQFEAHGNKRDYAPGDCDWDTSDPTDTGKHAIVSAALNNHSCWNLKIEGDHPYEDNITGVAMIGNFLGGSYGDGSIWWKPWQTPAEFTQLGLDREGKPVNDQVWATFRGRMGDSYTCDLNGGTYFGGSNLSTWDWDWVKIVWAGGKILGKIKTDLQQADGPRGPGDRDWVHCSM
ncbi:hypothetical protein C7974DRAFT_451247 [Boeremia exigua]|uniref:uncharacterized protein n=1 Tax=Boeremia exigua TaxID=749465 RepID=UPI001E8CBB93|nr:uncharacterized protein C7974DRAFT_451247 [Boeremia exigua]KAH6638039.1 hypothetical protein C7974DRAFT_451247 [Boeremia exigua]